MISKKGPFVAFHCNHEKWNIHEWHRIEKAELEFQHEITAIEKLTKIYLSYPLTMSFF